MNKKGRWYFTPEVDQVSEGAALKENRKQTCWGLQEPWMSRVDSATKWEWCDSTRTAGIVPFIRYNRKKWAFKGWFRVLATAKWILSFLWTPHCNVLISVLYRHVGVEAGPGPSSGLHTVITAVQDGIRGPRQVFSPLILNHWSRN